MRTQTISYMRHRFPPAIISHAVWLYCRFNLSLREVEEMFLRCGVDVSYETIRRWVAKFGPSIALGLRRRQPRPGDIWHLDEVVVKIGGGRFWLWRAVDQDGLVPDEILQGKRDKRAAKRLLHKLMKRAGSVETTWVGSQAHHHSQTAIQRRGQARDRSGRRTSLSQRAKQSGREQPSAVSKARKNDARS